MMEEPSIFMQMVWANFVWATATMVIITLPLFLFGRWKLKKMKAKQIEQMKEHKKNEPRVIAFGVPMDEPGHCPLCGQGWPLDGPLYKKPEEPQETQNG